MNRGVKFVLKVVVGTVVVLITLCVIVAAGMSSGEKAVHDSVVKSANCYADVMDEANARTRDDMSNLSDVMSWETRELASRCY